MSITCLTICPFATNNKKNNLMVLKSWKIKNYQWCLIILNLKLMKVVEDIAKCGVNVESMKKWLWKDCRNPTLAKCKGESQHSQSWGLGVLWDSRMFRVRQQGPKHFALRCSWCHWKGLEA